MKFIYILLLARLSFGQNTGSGSYSPICASVFGIDGKFYLPVLLTIT